MSYSDDTALFDFGATLSNRISLGLRKLGDNTVPILLSFLESLGLSSIGFVREEFLVEFAFVSDPNVEPVVLFVGLIDS